MYFDFNLGDALLAFFVLGAILGGGLVWLLDFVGCI